MRIELALVTRDSSGAGTAGEAAVIALGADVFGPVARRLEVGDAIISRDGGLRLQEGPPSRSRRPRSRRP